MNSRQFMWLLVLGGLTLPGCSVIPGPSEMVTRIGYFIECVSDENSLETERRRLQVEAQRKEIKLEREALRTAATDDVEAQRDSFEDSVRTKLGVNVDYDMQVGTPQIDVQSLKVCLENYDTKMVAYNQHVEAIRKRNELNLNLATQAEIRQILDAPEGSAAQVAFWTKHKHKDKCCPPSCALPNFPRAPEAQTDIPPPTAPQLSDLKINVPITLKIGGDGGVDDAGRRLEPKPDRTPEAQRGQCGAACGAGGCTPSCEVPCKPKFFKWFKGASIQPAPATQAFAVDEPPDFLESLVVEEVPAFDDDGPSFDDSAPNVLVPPPFEAAASEAPARR